MRGNSTADFNRPTVFDDLTFWLDSKGSAPWLVDLKAGNEHVISWRDGADEIDRAAKAIQKHLPDNNKKIAILAKNCAHWILADLAILKSGNVTVPVFTTMRADTFNYVLDFADVDLLFLGESPNWPEVKDHIPEGVTVVTLPGVNPAEGHITWDTFLTVENSPNKLTPPQDTEALATIIFTSGTTGKPKGVMHSLASLGRATNALINGTETEAGWRFFSYLPLAHLAERLIIELHALKTGGTIYFNENLESFGSDLSIAKPDYFFGVPRVWDKLIQGVIAGTEGGAETLRQALTGPNKELVAASIREKLGFSSVKHMLTSTAPVPPHIKEWYQLMGLELQDGYGQTEILPLVTSPKGSNKPHSVGCPVDGVEIKITDEGELVARAPGRSLGYYKMPQQTADTFRDGWVHTGDRAEIDEDGYIILKGRLKETFKTAKGKYVAPMPIEARFLEHDLLDQACMVGHGLPQPVLLVVLAEAAIGLTQDDIEAYIRDHVAAVNSDQERHAQVGAVLIAPEAWTIENGILTHTMKVRRDRVLDRFEADIERVAQNIHQHATLMMKFL